MATDEWRFEVNGVQLGPVTARQLRALAHAKTLSPDDLVQKGADGKWVRAGKVQGLFENPIGTSEMPPKAAGIDSGDVRAPPADTPESETPAVEGGNQASSTIEPADLFDGPADGDLALKRNDVRVVCFVAALVIVLIAVIIFSSGHTAGNGQPVSTHSESARPSGNSVPTSASVYPGNTCTVFTNCFAARDEATFDRAIIVAKDPQAYQKMLESGEVVLVLAGTKVEIIDYHVIGGNAKVRLTGDPDYLWLHSAWLK